MRATNTDWERFTAVLIESGLLIPTGVPGVYGRSASFESITAAFELLITRSSEEQGAVRIFFPPVMNRTALALTGYMQSFPELCGSVHSFCGNDHSHAALLETIDEDLEWGPHLMQTDVTLVPAACYPLYPTLAGSTLGGSRLFDLSSYVFRHEPSPDPTRMQIFRMKENVRVGTPDDVANWREAQMESGLAIFKDLDLDVKLEIANDPFFGRGGKMLAKNQTVAKLKFEITIELFDQKPAVAIASFNYHEDKFGSLFNIRNADGSIAHTGCLGFGLERVTLALFRIHGLDPSSWPMKVRSTLAL